MLAWKETRTSFESSYTSGVRSNNSKREARCLGRLRVPVSVPKETSLKYAERVVLEGTSEKRLVYSLPNEFSPLE